MFALQNTELYTTFLKAFAKNRDVQNKEFNLSTSIISADGPHRYCLHNHYASIWTKIRKKNAQWM